MVEALGFIRAMFANPPRIPCNFSILNLGANVRKIEFFDNPFFTFSSVSITIGGCTAKITSSALKTSFILLVVDICENFDFKAFKAWALTSKTVMALNWILAFLNAWSSIRVIRPPPIKLIVFINNLFIGLENIIE
jgi:hypothetical protein